MQWQCNAFCVPRQCWATAEITDITKATATINESKLTTRHEAPCGHHDGSAGDANGNIVVVAVVVIIVAAVVVVARGGGAELHSLCKTGGTNRSCSRSRHNKSCCNFATCFPASNFTSLLLPLPLPYPYHSHFPLPRT